MAVAAPVFRPRRSLPAVLRGGLGGHPEAHGDRVARSDQTAEVGVARDHADRCSARAEWLRFSRHARRRAGWERRRYMETEATSGRFTRMITKRLRMSYDPHGAGRSGATTANATVGAVVTASPTGTPRLMSPRRPRGRNRLLGFGVPEGALLAAAGSETASTSGRKQQDRRPGVRSRAPGRR